MSSIPAHAHHRTQTRTGSRSGNGTNLGTIAALGLVGRFVKWLFDIRLINQQTKEIKSRNDEREKKEKCDAIRQRYCDEFLRVKQSGIVVRDLDHLLELVPLRNTDEESLRTEAYGLVLHGKYHGVKLPFSS